MNGISATIEPPRSRRDSFWKTRPSREVAKWIALFAAIFLAWLWASWEWVSAPPYWDALATWVDADFLADHPLDIDGLRRDVHQSHGGRMAYVTSLRALSISLLMLALSPPCTLVVDHLLIVFCATLVVWLLAILIRRRHGWAITFMTALAAASAPLTRSQAEQIGLEMPLAAATLLTAWCLATGRDRWAAASAMLAFLIKPTGAIVLFACLLTMALRAAFLRLRGRETPVGALSGSAMSGSAMALAAALLSLAIGITYWAGVLSLQASSAQRHALGQFPMIVIWCPDLALWFVVAVLAGGAQFLDGARSALGIGSRDRARFWEPAIQTDREPELVFALLCLIGLMAATLRINLLPRYLTTAIPLMAMILASALRARPRVLGTALVLVIVFHGINAGGSLYPSIARWGASAGRNGALYERSLEYRDDHRGNIAMTRLAERIGRDRALPIVTGFWNTYVMALPRLGYVQEPVAGYTGNDVVGDWCSLKNISETPLDELPERALFLYRPTGYEGKAAWVVPPPDDRQCERHFYQSGSPPMALYEKSFDSKADRENWYERQLFALRTPGERARFLSDFLSRPSRWRDRLEELSRIWESAPSDPAVAMVFAKALKDSNSPRGAQIADVGAVPRDGREGESTSNNEFASAIRMLEIGAPGDAAKTLTPMARREPNDAAIAYELATALAQQGEWKQALAVARGSVDIDRWPALHRLRSVIDHRLGGRDRSIP